jgi:hypothetical protein
MTQRGERHAQAFAGSSSVELRPEQADQNLTRMHTLWVECQMREQFSSFLRTKASNSLSAYADTKTIEQFDFHNSDRLLVHLFTLHPCYN